MRSNYDAELASLVESIERRGAPETTRQWRERYPLDGSRQGVSSHPGVAHAEDTLVLVEAFATAGDFQAMNDEIDRLERQFEEIRANPDETESIKKRLLELYRTALRFAVETHAERGNGEEVAVFAARLHDLHETPRTEST